MVHVAYSSKSSRSASSPQSSSLSSPPPDTTAADNDGDTAVVVVDLTAKVAGAGEIPGDAAKLGVGLDMAPDAVVIGAAADDVHGLVLDEGLVGFVVEVLCENFGCDDSPIEAKISSSVAPMTGFFFGAACCGATGFFAPRLVILVGTPPMSGGSMDEMLVVPPPAPLPLLILLVPPEIGAGGGITGRCCCAVFITPSVIPGTCFIGGFNGDAGGNDIPIDFFGPPLPGLAPSLNDLLSFSALGRR